MTPHTPTPRSAATRIVSLLTAALAALGLGVAIAPSTAAASMPAAAEVTRDAAADALRALETWTATHDPADYLRYVELRDDAARAASAEVEVAATDLVRAWATADPTNQVAVLAALTQLGVPYRSMASVEGEGFDCSGLTSYAYRKAGIELPRISGDQMDANPAVERAEADAGDLVYFPGHVMMYLGVGDAIVHALNTGRDVELDTIAKSRTSSVRFADPTP